MAAHPHDRSRRRPDTKTTRSGVCPSCGHQVTFSYNGQQVWPEHIAAAMGISPVVPLWNCGNCHSTISETSLDEAGE